MSDVLGAIDGALRDYETGPDAMRWTADPAARQSIAIGADAGVSAAVFLDIQATATQFGARLAEVGTGLRQVYAVLGKAVGTMSGSLNEFGVRWTHAIARENDRRHRVRCGYCNPAGNPPPVAGKYGPGPKAARMHRRRP